MKLLHLIFALVLLPVFASAQFNRDLYFGLRNDTEVSRLQVFLKDQGHFAYPEITGNFFTVTREAVIKFQKANNISPAVGYFGPLTRAAANKLSVASSPGGISPYKGKIKISYVSGYSDKPEYESISIENRSDRENISITGFVIQSDRASFTVPRAFNLPGFEAVAQDPVLLKPRGRALITAGMQARMMDFRENICTGYFSETSEFIPYLSQSCPRPETKNLLYLSDRCLSLMERTPSCRMPNTRDTFIESDCSEYLSRNLNYVGCVNNYRGRSDFFSDQWLIWMQRKEEFFRNTHDKIILQDPQGRIVDEYSY